MRRNVASIESKANATWSVPGEDRFIQKRVKRDCPLNADASGMKGFVNNSSNAFAEDGSIRSLLDMLQQPEFCGSINPRNALDHSLKGDEWIRLPSRGSARSEAMKRTIIPTPKELYEEVLGTKRLSSSCETTVASASFVSLDSRKKRSRTDLGEDCNNEQYCLALRQAFENLALERDQKQVDSTQSLNEWVLTETLRRRELRKRELRRRGLSRASLPTIYQPGAK